MVGETSGGGRDGLKLLPSLRFPRGPEDEEALPHREACLGGAFAIAKSLFAFSLQGLSPGITPFSGDCKMG